MRIGHSLATSETISAEHVEYGDCAKYQVVCPVCREAVFKALRQVADRPPVHYLSHYHADSDEARHCELRVEVLAKEHHAKLVAVNHGQTLAGFMATFRDSLVRAQDSLRVLPGRVLWQDAHKILVRTDFDVLERPVRMLTDCAAWLVDEKKETPGWQRDDLTRELSKMRPFRDRSPFWLRRQASYVLDVVTHLVTDQARANFKFTAACVYSLLYRATGSYELEGLAELDQRMMRNVARVACEGGGPAKIRQLIDARMAQTTSASAASGYAAGFASGMGSIFHRSVKHRPLDGFVEHPMTLPDQVELAEAKIKVFRALEERKRAAREEGKKLDQRLFDVTAAAAAWGPFYGLLAAVPLRGEV